MRTHGFSLALMMLACLSGRVIHAQTCPSLAWSASYDSGEPTANNARGLVVDDDGNVYVTGNLSHAGLVQPIGTAKFDSNGHRLWASEFVGPANFVDRAKALAVDAAGNVYVTGDTLFNNFDLGLVTLKYNSLGQLQWSQVRHATQGDEGHALALDSAGKPCVAGFSERHWLLIKYTTVGAVEWTALFDPGTFNALLAPTVGIDSSDNVYIGGNTTNNTLAVRKYNSAGALQWMGTHVVSNQSVNGRTLVVDAAGHSWVAGAMRAFGAPQRDGFLIVKFDSAGVKQWAVEVPDPVSAAIQFDGFGPRDAAVDSAGNVIVTGMSWSGPTAYDVLTVKVDPDGNLLWARRHNGPESNFDIGFKVAVDANDRIVVLGTMAGKRAPAYFVARYEADGEVLWTDAFAPGFFDLFNPASLDVAIGPGNTIHTLGNPLRPKDAGSFFLIRQYAQPEAVAAGLLGFKPKPLNVGTAAVDGANPKIKKMKLSNASTTECLLVDASVSGPPFLGGGQYLLQPKGKLSLPIAFSPSEVGAVTGSLSLVTCDPAQPLVEIQLVGAGK